MIRRLFRRYFLFSITNYHHTPMRISSHLRHCHCTHRSMISLVIPVIAPNFLKRKRVRLGIAKSLTKHTRLHPQPRACKNFRSAIGETSAAMRLPRNPAIGVPKPEKSNPDLSRSLCMKRHHKRTKEHWISVLLQG